MKQRRALLRKLKAVFRRWISPPVERVIIEINPIRRGWVNDFRVGNAGRCFRVVQTWVEKKIRRHVMRASARQGFGWKRWGTARISTALGVFADYRVQYGT
jgi:RNA-directed DNA polymerase